MDTECKRYYTYYPLCVADLPPRAQKFIDIMKIDISNLDIELVKTNKEGLCAEGFIENANGFYSRKICTIFLIGKIRTRTCIHELSRHHFYNLSYPSLTLTPEGETLCEMLSIYGTRGQFNKIEEIRKILAGEENGKRDL